MCEHDDVASEAAALAERVERLKVNYRQVQQERDREASRAESYAEGERIMRDERNEAIAVRDSAMVEIRRCHERIAELESERARKLMAGFVPDCPAGIFGVDANRIRRALRMSPTADGDSIAQAAERFYDLALVRGSALSRIAKALGLVDEPNNLAQFVEAMPPMIREAREELDRAVVERDDYHARMTAANFSLARLRTKHRTLIRRHLALLIES